MPRGWTHTNRYGSHAYFGPDPNKSIEGSWDRVGMGSGHKPQNLGLGAVGDSRLQDRGQLLMVATVLLQLGGLGVGVGEREGGLGRRVTGQG